jgi:hypothetical protein
VLTTPKEELRWRPERVNYGLVSTLTKIIHKVGSLKRTVAAYTVLLGLTAVMIGLYVNDFKAISDVIRGYVALFP